MYTPPDSRPDAWTSCPYREIYKVCNKRMPVWTIVKYIYRICFLEWISVSFSHKLKGTRDLTIWQLSPRILIGSYNHLFQMHGFQTFPFKIKTCIYNKDTCWKTVFFKIDCRHIRLLYISTLQSAVYWAVNYKRQSYHFIVLLG